MRNAPIYERPRGRRSDRVADDSRGSPLLCVACCVNKDRSEGNWSERRNLNPRPPAPNAWFPLSRDDRPTRADADGRCSETAVSESALRWGCGKVCCVSGWTICRRFHVNRLEVFGSAARGSDFDPPRSDVDLLVTYLPGHQSGIAAHQNLRDALEDLLGRPVDLVMEAAVENPFVRAGINGSRQAIYAA
jgi:predicted nucleotidyltransferase